MLKWRRVRHHTTLEGTDMDKTTTTYDPSIGVRLAHYPCGHVFALDANARAGKCPDQACKAARRR